MIAVCGANGTIGSRVVARFEREVYAESFLVQELAPAGAAFAAPRTGARIALWMRKMLRR